jgi:hypothetical protein
MTHSVVLYYYQKTQLAVPHHKTDDVFLSIHYSENLKLHISKLISKSGTYLEFIAALLVVS